MPDLKISAQPTRSLQQVRTIVWTALDSPGVRSADPRLARKIQRRPKAGRRRFRASRDGVPPQPIRRRIGRSGTRSFKRQRRYFSEGGAHAPIFS